MASAETVLSGAAVRGLELHKIAERRRAAGLLAPPALVGSFLGWVRLGLLPPEAVAQIIVRLLEKPAFTTPDGTVDRAAVNEIIERCLEELRQHKGAARAGAAPHLDALAKALTRRMGGWCLAPDRLDWLAKIIRGWADVGALPPEARLLTEDVLRQLAGGPFLTRLAEALRAGDEEKCAELLRQFQAGGGLGLRTVERRRREAGLVPGPACGEGDPETNLEFLLRGDFLAGEGRAETACRSLEALRATLAALSDEALNAAVRRRNDTAGAFAGAEHAADMEALVLEALVLQALSHRELSQRTTGLALSGGGLRSASFNLGLLQALYRGGLLRWVDYLSTVSGGTYIGAWLSTRVAQQAGPVTRGDGFRPLTDRKDGGEGSAIKRLIRAGYYLNHPLVFTSRYVFGLLTVNLVLLSFLLLGCVVVAGAWRLLDEPPLCETILVLTGGVVIEAYRPFLVAAVLLVAWLIGWGLAASRQNHTSRALHYGVPLALLAVTAGWPVLEWYGKFLEPDHPLWRLARPLPLVLLLAWLLAWQVTAPFAPSPADRAGWRAQAGRFALGVVVPLAALWAVWLAAGARFTLPYGAEVAGTVALVAGSVVWVGHWALRLALGRAAGPPTPFQIAKRLQWLLLLSGASFLVGWAVWFATPSINLVPTTSTAFTLPDQGTIEHHRSWLYPLLAGLIASLVPFLNPRRMLESGTNPKRFWEPWLFRLACVGAVIGVPLLAVHLFSRHNLSGYNTVRSPEILPGEIDLPGFFKRVKQDVEEERPAVAAKGLPAAPAPGSQPRWKLVGDWDDLNQRPLPGGLTVKAAMDDDPGLAQILRQQPVPLSGRAAAKKRAVVEHLNAVLFPKGASPAQEEAATPEKLFHPLLEKQRRIEESKGDKTGQWQTWPAIKKMLHELHETRWVTDADREERQALEHRVTRLVLEADYLIEEKDVPHRQNVIHQDQLARLARFVVLLGVCGLALRRAHLNASSLHSFYRDQLAWAFLAAGKEGPGEPAGEQQRALSTLDAARNGGPYHLINSTLNTLTIPQLVLKAFGKSEAAGPAGPVGLTDCFVFGRDFVGSETCGYAWTVDYEKTSGVRLRDAVALSGAAVTLTQIDNPLLLLLMTALNLRLGQWLPSPRHHQGLGAPTLSQLLSDGGEAAGRRYFFVSDGGHHDNLGLGSLLKRRCRLIIVSDATCDPTYSFADFCRVCRQARREDGVEFYPLGPSGAGAALPLDEVRPLACQEGRPKDKAGACPAPPDGPEPSAAAESDSGPKPVKECKNRDWMSAAHYFLARVEYPRRSGPRPGGEEGSGAEVGYLIYLKPSLTGDEAIDLKGHWRASREFPHDPTANQFFNEDMVESYRQLGEHIGEQLCADVCRAGEDLWDFDALHFERALSEFIRAAQGQPSAAVPLPTEPCATADNGAQAAVPVGAGAAATTYWPHGPHTPTGGPG